MQTKSYNEILEAVKATAKILDITQKDNAKYSEKGQAIINELNNQGIALFYSEPFGESGDLVADYFSEKLSCVIIVDNDLCEFFDDFEELAEVIYNTNLQVIATEKRIK